MRIFWKEFKKLFDIKLIVLLGVFTVLFYIVYMQIYMYPAGGQMTNSPYDMPCAAELIKDIGPVLKLDDWSKFTQKKQQKTDEINKIIAADEKLTKEGISTIEQMYNWENNESEKESPKNTRIENEVDRLRFDDKKTSKLMFELQFMNRIEECRGSSTGYGVEKKALEKFEKELLSDNDYTEYYMKNIEKRVTKDYVSFLPAGMYYVLGADMQHMAVLIIICSFAIIIISQIKERIRGVLPLYVTSKTGRGVFKKQLQAVVAASFSVGVIQCMIYVAVFCIKGLYVFWRCENWPFEDNVMFLDNISFGAYMVIYIMMVLIFSAAVAVPAYLIGRLAVNYIVGIAMSIPVCIVIGKIMFNILYVIFSLEQSYIMEFKPLFVILAGVLLAVIIAGIIMKADKTRDVKIC